MLSVKFRAKDGRSLVCITFCLSIMKDYSSTDCILVLANASRFYETFGNNIKKDVTSNPKAVLRALCLSFSE